MAAGVPAPSKCPGECSAGETASAGIPQQTGQVIPHTLGPQTHSSCEGGPEGTGKCPCAALFGPEKGQMLGACACSPGYPDPWPAGSLSVTARVLPLCAWWKRMSHDIFLHPFTPMLSSNQPWLPPRLDAVPSALAKRTYALSERETELSCSSGEDLLENYGEG